MCDLCSQEAGGVQRLEDSQHCSDVRRGKKEGRDDCRNSGRTNMLSVLEKVYIRIVNCDDYENN